MIRPYRLAFLFLVAIQGVLCFSAGAAESSRALAILVGDPRSDRVAVVIGNSNYPSGALANPKNDATAMAAMLKKLGFEVELKVDATKADLDGIFKRLSIKAERATVAALFYAGHGIQVNGSNYIVPVDARPQNERDLKREMVRMDDVIDDMGNAKVKLVFFDACRDNPLARTFSRGGARGMAAPVEATGTLISFATKHGNTAADGTGTHSPYTKALLEALEAPAGVEIEQILRKVQQGVRQATNGQQEPWRYGSLDGDFYFLAAAPKADNAALQQEAIERSVQEAMKRANDQAISEALRRASEQQAKDRETSAIAVEMSYWNSIKEGQSAEDFKAYIARYPSGSFVDLARNRIVMLDREAARQIEESRRASKVAPTSAVADHTAVELAFWESIKDRGSKDDFKEYLTNYPQGRFAGLARNRIRDLEAASAQAAANPMPQEVSGTARVTTQPPPGGIAILSPDKPISAQAVSPGYPQIGDSWTYRYVDVWKKDSPQVVQVRVVESEGGQVTDRMSIVGGRVADERRSIGAVDVAERALGQGVRIIEIVPYLQGLLQNDLKVGQERSFPDGAIGAHTFRINGKLLGQESVTVSAGTFNAMRVDIEGVRLGNEVLSAYSAAGLASVPRTFSYRLWFVPEVKRVVKVEYRSNNSSNSRLDDEGLDLVSYSLR